MNDKTYYEIDKEGQIIGQFENAPPEDSGLRIVNTHPPDEKLLKPRWDDASES